MTNLSQNWRMGMFATFPGGMRRFPQEKLSTCFGPFSSERMRMYTGRLVQDPCCLAWSTKKCHSASL